MSLVLDCSMTLSWCFEDERDLGSVRVLDLVAESGAVVPSLWRYEVANGLLMAQRRKRIDARRRRDLLTELAHLTVKTDPGLDQQLWRGIPDLADRHGLTVYDASYLDLAQRLRLPLATRDAALTRAASAEGVKLA